MNAKPRYEAKENSLCIDTKELMQVTDSGYVTAVRIGTDAGAKIKIGRRTLWNLAKVRQFLDEVSG